MSLPKKKKRKEKTLLSKEMPSTQESSICLGKDQQNAFNKLSQFLKESKQDFFLLTGYAGTGKSTLCSEVIQAHPTLRFALCSTTNKAVGVLKDMQAEQKHPLPCYTIYNLLGLVPFETKGEVSLIKMKASQLSKIDVVIIDECSMIGQELWKHIQEIPCEAPVKVIFIGDPAQLPPVGEESSPSFNIPSHAHLSEVLRQSADNPIIRLSMNIRKAMELNQELEDPTEAILNNKGVFCIDNEDEWLEMIMQNYSQKEAQQNPNECRILTWTNKRVHELNQAVQNKILGCSDTPFHSNQCLILTSPVYQSRFNGKRQVLLNTDDIIRVRSVEPASFQEENLWEISGESIEGQFVRFFYVPFEEQNAFRQKFNEAKREAGNNSFALKKLNHFEQGLAKAQAPYAITTHRSQGSTFNTSFIDLPSILSNPNYAESLRMLYVAVTRSKNKVILYTGAEQKE
ncbi:MAG: AAA family ATPase [Planctomycetes bacterium]|nr:AAA family ATPase [Planctomycetota bacterium]